MAIAFYLYIYSSRQGDESHCSLRLRSGSNDLHRLNSLGGCYNSNFRNFGLTFLELAVELAAQDCKFSPFGIETHRQIPPYLSTTICQLIDSPIPVPLPLDFLVKNGSNILPRTSSLIPTPLAVARRSQFNICHIS